MITFETGGSSRYSVSFPTLFNNPQSPGQAAELSTVWVNACFPFQNSLWEFPCKWPKVLLCDFSDSVGKTILETLVSWRQSLFLQLHLVLVCPDHWVQLSHKVCSRFCSSLYLNAQHTGPHVWGSSTYIKELQNRSSDLSVFCLTILHNGSVIKTERKSK